MSEGLGAECLHLLSVAELVFEVLALGHFLPQLGVGRGERRRPRRDRRCQSALRALHHVHELLAL
jgi:hypothetical protein